MQATVTFPFTVSGSAQSLPLLGPSNFQYLGAFRVPGSANGLGLEYGGTALSYNPTNNSLWMVGNDQQQKVAEINIPAIVNSSNLSSLATATIRQPLVSVMNRIPNGNHDVNGEKIGGFLSLGSQLIGTQYSWYDNNNLPNSHFKMSTQNLASASVTGLFRLTASGVSGGYFAGYMATIPAAWQTLLGAAHMTGQATLSIASRTSQGPCVFGFNPADLGPTAIPAVPYVYYTVDHFTLGPLTGPANPIFNGCTLINGVVFPTGTRSVVFFGSTGMTAVGYGEAAEFNDNNRDYKTYHAQNGVYSYYAWAYDANDFLAVKNGTKQPWELLPYQTWAFDFPITTGEKWLGGVAFDPVTNNLYLSQLRAGGDKLPLVMVFRVIA